MSQFKVRCVRVMCQLIIAIGWSNSANILIVNVWPGRSHYLMFRPIAFELARREHNVTAITAFKEEQYPKNYRQIVVDTKTVFGKSANFFDLENMSDEERHNQILWKGGLATTEKALNSTQVQQFFKEDNEFDLVISEQFYQEAFYMLSHKYKAPLVLVSTFGNCMRHNILTRTPLQLTTSFSEFIELRDTTSFLSRLYNIYFTFYEYFWWNFSFMKQQEKLVKNYISDLPEPVPSLYDIQRNTSIFLMNRHFSFESPVGYLPNSIEIGGVHLESTQPLPNDLQKILDESTNGVLYLSFGTLLRFSDLPADKRGAFVNVFKRINATILLKFEDGIFENKPNNVVTRKWFPQREVLAHPNVKAFIHHGGIFGLQEAITCGVPIIGIPIFGDQYRNLIQLENMGVGRILRYNDINEDNLEKILIEVLKSESYKKNAVELAKRFQDRPMKVLDTAIYWIEYAIRHGHSDFMKNPSLKLNWFAYNMIDVGLFFIALVLFLYYTIIKISTTFIRFIRLERNATRYKKQV